jgi:hypothetical protein
VQVLKAHFGVRFECFASPLNCTFGHFCSAFPDTDRHFGSYGSFFHFRYRPEVACQWCVITHSPLSLSCLSPVSLCRPSSGSFEANPPFITEVMAAMVLHLANALGPLSFVVIVPGMQQQQQQMESHCSSA